MPVCDLATAAGRWWLWPLGRRWALRVADRHGHRRPDVSSPQGRWPSMCPTSC